MNLRECDILCMAMEAMRGLSCRLERGRNRVLVMEISAAGRLVARASSLDNCLEVPVECPESERLEHFRAIARRRVAETGRGGMVEDVAGHPSRHLKYRSLDCSLDWNTLCCIRLACAKMPHRKTLCGALERRMLALCAENPALDPGYLARPGELRRREWNNGKPRATRRRPAPEPDMDPAAWMAERGVAIGDMLDVTNAAGRTFTGRLVEFRQPLGYIALDGDPRFAFSMTDAVVRRSRRTRPSRFASLVEDGELDWRAALDDAPPLGWDRHVNTGR